MEGHHHLWETAETVMFPDGNGITVKLTHVVYTTNTVPIVFKTQVPTTLNVMPHIKKSEYLI